MARKTAKGPTIKARGGSGCADLTMPDGRSIVVRSIDTAGRYGAAYAAEAQRAGRGKVADRPGACCPANESDGCPVWIRREPDGSVSFWERT